jgi:hypothetical protein
VVEIMEEYYSNKIREIAKQLEELRKEIYQKTEHNIDKEFFEHTDNLLFKAQSDLNYTIAEAVSLLDYKEN